MQNSAGPSGQPCCVPSIEGKSAHVASVASGALGPRRAQTTGQEAPGRGGALLQSAVAEGHARESPLKALFRPSSQTAKPGRSSSTD
jgi:hypothetical protein